MAHDQEKAYEFERAEQTFIQRVYQWMAIGLSVTGAVALWIAGSPALLRALTGGVFLVLMLIEIGIVFWLSSQVMKISSQAAITGFLVYSGLNGVILSTIFIVYTQTSIASVFFMTAGTFAAVSIYGWTTKQDLTSMGSFLFMGLIGIIIASLVNFFLRSPVIYWLISYAGLAVFIGLTAYDTQKLKRIQQSGIGASEQVAILGALQLYLDFINMFLMLLRIFGRRR
ncbi:MAG: Bax inhibitor-1/YccA family protein [Candidatus Omnitrophica bacterium]|nr:Bax inhibitor-1/YccA family protein [Candidatus Omnitrophota bacterium]MDD5670541.1 Bax inhibitor-1/YccA family protein [Candidatus Omnitrophota bacterium]